jgi:uncharacterized protein YndB with AHSA1/START domain
MASISLQKTINKDAETIFCFLTEQNLLMQWFAPQAIATPLENTIAAFAFGSDVNFKMRITELSKFNKLAWLCVDGTVDWLDSSITFTINETSESSCTIDFIQDNLNKPEKMEQWKSSWTEYFELLAEKCEQYSF